jgi:hypothetical protein
MQGYLRQQWASMFNGFLTQRQQTQSVADVLNQINKTNAQVEYLSRQIAASVGDKTVQVKIKAYDLLIESRVARYLADWGIKVNPQEILLHETLDSICGSKIEVDKRSEDEEDGTYSYTYGGPPYSGSKEHIDMLRKLYEETRIKIVELVRQEGLKVQDIINKP